MLDVGCGDGLVGSRLGDDVVGIDVRPPEASAIPTQAFDGRTIPFGDRSFDTVVASAVLHHADDPRGLLAEMLRVGRQVVILELAYETFVQRASAVAVHELIRRFVGLPYRRDGFLTPARRRQLLAELPCRVVAAERHPSVMPLWPGLQHDLIIIEPTV